MSDLKAAINAKDTTPTAGGQVPTAPETPKAAAPAAAPSSPLASFKNMLEQMKPALNQALPKHINPERMSRIILTTFTQNPLLLQCTRESVIGSILVSAQLGLEIGQGTGEAYLVPFKRKGKNGSPDFYECVLIAGYQGYIKLARQSGEIKSIFADAVHVGDDFTWKRSLDGDIFEHTPKFESEEITHFYALATFKSGGHALVCWPYAKVIAHALKHSKETDWNTKAKVLPKMWRDNLEPMGCKTMIRQLWKWLPRSPEMQRAQEMDGAAIHANAKTGEIMDLLPTPHNDDYNEPEELQIDQETGEVING